MDLPYKNREILDLPGEIWVDTFGYDGLYEVSNKGRIKSLSRIVRNGYGERMMKGRVLSQGKIHHKGTKQISLFVNLANGDSTTSIKTVASLVLNSFKKPDEYNNNTHHINGVSSDNRLKNLTFEDLSTKRKIEFDIGLRDGDRNVKHWRDKGFPMSKTKEEMLELKKMVKVYGVPFEKRKKQIVTVYIEQSGFIGSYTCIKNASRQLNIKEYTLRNALNKPHKFKYIQVKIGIHDIASFKPRQRKEVKMVMYRGEKYLISQLSSKYSIRISTLYNKIKTLTDEGFNKWLEISIKKSPTN